MIETLSEPASGEPEPSMPCENDEVGRPASSAPSPTSVASTPGPVLWIPLALLLVLPLLPPETRGESLAGCALLVALWAVLSAAKLGGTPLARWLPTGAAVAVGLALAGEAPGAAVAPLTQAALAVVVGGCAMVTLRDREQLAVRVLGVAAALVACHALYQRFWGLSALVEQIDAGWVVADAELIRRRALGGRAFAAFSTPAALGGFLAITLPVTAAAAYTARGRARLLWIAGGALQAAGFLAALSATAVAALAGALTLALLTRRGLRRWLPVLLLAAGLIGLLVAGSRDDVLDFQHPEHPLRLRAGNFRIAADIASDHPWIGVGPGGYAEAFPRYRRAGDNESRHVHDLPLELSAELGWPLGAAASLGFFALFLAPLWRMGRCRPAPLRQGIAIGLAAFALHNLLDFTAFLPSILWVALLLWGTTASFRRETGASPAYAAVAVAVLAGLLAVGMGLGENARDAAMQARARGDEATVAALARRAVRRAPWEMDGWLLWSSSALVDGNHEAAASRVERALMLAPRRPGAHALRARVRYRAGDVPGAWADAAEAARLYPMRTVYAEERDELFGQLPRPPVEEIP